MPTIIYLINCLCAVLLVCVCLELLQMFTTFRMGVSIVILSGRSRSALVFFAQLIITRMVGRGMGRSIIGTRGTVPGLVIVHTSLVPRPNHVLPLAYKNQRK